MGFVVWLLQLSAAAVATCNTSIASTTPTSEFTDHGDGTISHHKSALMWSKCTVGSDILDCSGTAVQYNWRAALAQAEGSVLGEDDFRDWRLPSIKEYATLVDRGCITPAINEVRFPLTLSEKYWSSSSDPSFQNKAWSMLFTDGSQYTDAKDSLFYIRLVRDLN